MWLFGYECYLAESYSEDIPEQTLGCNRRLFESNCGRCIGYLKSACDI